MIHLSLGSSKLKLMGCLFSGLRIFKYNQSINNYLRVSLPMNKSVLLCIAREENVFLLNLFNILFFNIYFLPVLCRFGVRSENKISLCSINQLIYKSISLRLFLFMILFCPTIEKVKYFSILYN